MRKFLFRIFLVIMSIQLGYSSQLNSDEYNLEHFAHLSASVAPGVKENTYFYKKNCWKDSRGNVLPFKAFYNFLESQGGRVLLELGRLILAQDLPNEHNTKKNKLDVVEPYLLQNNPVGLFNECNIDCLMTCSSIKRLVQHIFNAGHLGRYASSPYGRWGDEKVNSYNPRGMFNLIAPLKAKKLTDGIEEPMEFFPFDLTSFNKKKLIKKIYEPTEITLNPAYLIIKHIFSSQVEGVLPSDRDGYPPDLSRYLKWSPNPDNKVSAMPSLLLIENEKGRKRLVIDFSYKGDSISCLAPHMPIGIRSELSPNRYHWESTLTNQLRLVLEIEDDKIRLVSLYPLDDMDSIPEGWKKVK